ncbi:hypothetical protein PFISCL1PPCAC_5697, partial [Pristionchus fissidentatus]
GAAGVQGSPGDDGEYCACPPKSLPGIYSMPKPAPYVQPQPYYTTSYQNGPSSPSSQPYNVRYLYSLLPTVLLLSDTLLPTSTEVHQSHRRSINRPSFLTKIPGLQIVDSFWKRRHTD